MTSGRFGVDGSKDNEDANYEVHTLLNNEPTSRADNNNSLFSG